MKITVKKSPIIVPGFRFSGVACGLKPSGKKDLSLLVSDVPATAVAAFTTNQVKAAPVAIGEEIIRAGLLQAIVVNSGNANASTARPGLKLAQDTCALVGRELGIDAHLVLPSSTGVIGVLPDWQKMQTGIPAAAATLSPRGFWNAVAGIMTTDAFPKVSTRQVTLNGRTLTIAGMAKGAGMINPNMATMLCYVCTDAAVSRAALQQTLDQTLPDSFNAISVDGDTSTNDTLVLLANGRAGNREIRPRSRGYAAFRDAVREVLCGLARMCVKDGEGATQGSRYLRQRRKEQGGRGKSRPQHRLFTPGQNSLFRGRPELGPDCLRGRLCRRATGPGPAGHQCRRCAYWPQRHEHRGAQ